MAEQAKQRKKFNKLSFWSHSSLRVGFFLAYHQLKRSSKWTTALIISIMTLTFLNLVFVNGILAGLVAGSSEAYRKQYSGDLIIKNFEAKDFIPESSELINVLSNFDEVRAISPRVLVGSIVEANYKEIKNVNDNPDRISVIVAGVDLEAENLVTGLRDMVIGGDYLDETKEDEVLVGSNLLSNYSRDIPGDESLGKVDVGSKIRLVINGVKKEVKVRGVVKSKIGEVGRRIYTNSSLLRKILNRTNFDANEVAVLLQNDADPHTVKASLQELGYDKNGNIQTWEESQGQFFKDISNTFGMLGLMIGSIGVVVASITIFIVIYINAVTRKKFIGILKGIGIYGNAIEISYVIQSFFYGGIGSLIGLGLLYGVIKPYVDVNPIDFPFSDGILVAPLDGTMIRIAVLMIVTVIAGFVPAKMIVNKNTLDSILGR